MSKATTSVLGQLFATASLSHETANTSVLGRPIPDIPSMEDVSEAYVALHAKLMELYGRKRELDAKILEWNAAKRSTSMQRYSGGSQHEEEALNERVAAILGEEAIPSDGVLSFNDLGVKLNRDERDLDEAIKVITMRMTNERMRASVLVFDRVKPHLNALITELAGKMAEISHLAVQYRRFTDRLNDAQVAWSHEEVMTVDVGGVAYPYSPFANWLKAAAERGYLDPSKLPAEIRS